MRRTKWRDVLAAREQQEPGYIARVEEGARCKLEEYDAARRRLPDLRKAQQLTQSELAERLEVNQGQVSKLENQTDMYLSTLAGYVAALGGELKLVAVFDGQELPFELVTEPEPTSEPAAA